MDYLLGRYSTYWARYVKCNVPQPIQLDVGIAESAARLRDSLRLRLADAVQVASALAINAAALVTHDRDFSRVRSLRVIS